MKRLITTFFAGGLVALSLLGVAVAGPNEDAKAAYQRGDYATAVRLWRPLAEQGDARAQYSVGWMYENGRGVPHDYGQALDWLRKAADQGFAEAQFETGVMYAHGEGVPQDYAQALVWFRRAADQGFAAAQGAIGEMYQRGEGVPQDYGQALDWLRKAADQGSAGAQTKLGFMFQNGHGVQQDYGKALDWYRKAAEQGFAAAQFNIGEMYVHGAGVPKDYRQAISWYRKAAEQGFPEAQSALGWLCANPKALTRPVECAVRGQFPPEGPAFSAPPPRTQTQTATSRPGESTSAIRLQEQGGTFFVPVLINNSLTLNFIIDSGASDVSIPADVVLTLMRTGTLRSEDFIGSQNYKLADGTTVPSETFRLRQLTVGDREIENVTASVEKIEGSLLLGQSFLTRFKSWSIDNRHHVLLLD